MKSSEYLGLCNLPPPFGLSPKFASIQGPKNPSKISGFYNWTFSWWFRTEKCSRSVRPWIVAQPCSWKRCEKDMGGRAGGPSLDRCGGGPFPAFWAPSALSETPTYVLDLVYRKFLHFARCKMLKKDVSEDFHYYDCLSRIRHQETTKNKPTGHSEL